MAGPLKGTSYHFAQVPQCPDPAIGMGNDCRIVKWGVFAVRFQYYLNVGLVLGQDIGSGTEKGKVEFIGAQGFNDSGVIRCD